MKNTQELKIQAQKHHQEMLKLDDNYVTNTVYSNNVTVDHGDRELPCDIIVTDNDTVTEILNQCKNNTTNSVICALNFASFKNPGGGFLNGASAQEENLCMYSNLYEVLSIHKDFYEYNIKNDDFTGIYLNRAIYSEDIRFNKGTDNVYVDIITCACPNKSTKFLQKNPDKNTSALRSRIKFILDIAEHKCVETLILGAWGCGVFKQDPVEVANIFNELLADKRYQFSKVIFAIPPGNNNLAFKKIFK